MANSIVDYGMITSQASKIECVVGGQQTDVNTALNDLNSNSDSMFELQKEDSSSSVSYTANEGWTERFSYTIPKDGYYYIEVFAQTASASVSSIAQTNISVWLNNAIQADMSTCIVSIWGSNTGMVKGFMRLSEGDVLSFRTQSNLSATGRIVKYKVYYVKK